MLAVDDDEDDGEKNDRWKWVGELRGGVRKEGK